MEKGWLSQRKFNGAEVVSTNLAENSIHVEVLAISGDFTATDAESAPKRTFFSS